MKLTGRKALYFGAGMPREGKLVTLLCEPVMSPSGMFVISYMTEEGSLNQHILEFFKVLPEEIELAKANDERSEGEEWQPDWSKIKYDHLRMDADNSWWSFERDDDLRFDGNGDWFSFNSRNNPEEQITYKHPDPANAIYTRPKGEM